MTWLSGSVRGLVLGVVCGALATACGGSDDGESNGPAKVTLNSGVAPEKKVSELSSEEALQLCNEYSAVVETSFETDEMKRAGCVTMAVFNAHDVANCNEQVTECLKLTASSSSDLTASTQCHTDQQARSSCTATVSEMEACFGEAIGVAQGFYRAVTCENLLNALAGKAAFPLRAEAPTCAAIESKCPQAHIDDSTL